MAGQVGNVNYRSSDGQIVSLRPVKLLQQHRQDTGNALVKISPWQGGHTVEYAKDLGSESVISSVAKLERILFTEKKTVTQQVTVTKVARKSHCRTISSVNGAEKFTFQRIGSVSKGDEHIGEHECDSGFDSDFSRTPNTPCSPRNRELDDDNSYIFDYIESRLEGNVKDSSSDAPESDEYNVSHPKDSSSSSSSDESDGSSEDKENISKSDDSKKNSSVRRRLSGVRFSEDSADSGEKCETEASDTEKRNLRKKSIGLILYEHLPHWLQDNRYIISKYRKPLYSYASCLKTMLDLHTETVNIWTHLLGGSAFLLLGLYVLAMSSLPLGFMGTFVFGAFFISAVACMSLSAFYHTVCCHSPEVYFFSFNMDLTGISLLILGSAYPMQYFLFYDLTYDWMFYMILSTIAEIFVLRELFNNSKYLSAVNKADRSLVFCGYAALCGLIPLLHYGIVNGMYELVFQTFCPYILLSMGLYLAGTVIYTNHVPERFYPGKFDVFFNSHQIFHVLVILAALVHFVGVYRGAESKLLKL